MFKKTSARSPNDIAAKIAVVFNRSIYLLYLLGQILAFCSKYEKIKITGKIVRINHGEFIEKQKRVISPIKTPDENALYF